MIANARVPAVTIVLIVANLVAAFALVLFPDLPEQFGFRSAAPSGQSAFTSLFLHANLLHLLGNMVFLAAVGAAVELATGSIRFAIVYFLSGLIGVATHYVMTRGIVGSAPYIGASGAIAGCVAYYTVRYTAFRVPLAPRVGISVLAVTGIWLALQVVGAFVRLGDSGGVAFWAHLGGFVAGIVISLIFRAPDLGQAKLGHEVLERMNLRGPAAVAHAAREHLKTHPHDPKALWELVRAAEALGEADSQADALYEILEHGSPQDTPDALLRLCTLQRAGRLPAHKRTQFAQRYQAEYPELARALYMSIVYGPEDVQRPDAMLALAGLEREKDPESAQSLITALTREYPLHPAVELARTRGWVV